MVFGILLFGLPVVCLISALLYLPFYVSLRRTHMPLLRHLVFYGLIVCFGIISLATLFLGGITFDPPYYFLNLRPFIWLSETYAMGWDRMIEQLMLNILMFVPIGMLLPAAFPGQRRFHMTFLTCLAFTVFIETFQYFTGRSADIDDVIMNALGGCLGYLLYKLADRLLFRFTWWKKATGTLC